MNIQSSPSPGDVSETILAHEAALPPPIGALPDLCVTCHQPAAEGCTQCDRCMDEANRLWQHALHLRRMSAAADEAARKAKGDALDAFRRFNEANCTAPLSQQSSMRRV